MGQAWALWLFALPCKETEASLREAWLAELGSELVWKDDAGNPIDPFVCFRHFARSDFIGNVEGRPRGLKKDSVPSVLTPEPRGEWPGYSFMAASGRAATVVAKRRGRPPGGGRARGWRGRGSGGIMVSRPVVGEGLGSASDASGRQRGGKRRGRPPLNRVAGSASSATKHGRGSKRRGRPPWKHLAVAGSNSASSDVEEHQGKVESGRPAELEPDVEEHSGSANPDVEEHHGAVNSGHLPQSNPTVVAGSALNTTNCKGGVDGSAPAIVKVPLPLLPEGRHGLEKKYWGELEDEVICCKMVWIPERSLGDPRVSENWHCDRCCLRLSIRD